MSEDTKFWLVVGGFVATVFAAIALAVATANSTSYTFINDECLHYKHSDNRLFGQDTNVSETYCQATLTPED